MQRIQTPSGRFIDQTPLQATWLNSLQEELCQFILSRGLELSDQKMTLLKEACQNLTTQGLTSYHFQVAGVARQPTPLLGLEFDPTQIQGATFLMLSERPYQWGYIEKDLDHSFFHEERILRLASPVFVWYSKKKRAWQLYSPKPQLQYDLVVAPSRQSPKLAQVQLHFQENQLAYTCSDIHPNRKPGSLTLTHLKWIKAYESNS